MKQRVLALLLGCFLLAAPAYAQVKTVTGRVTSMQGTSMRDVQVAVRGAAGGTATDGAGRYTIRVAPSQVLLFRVIGHAPRAVTREDLALLDAGAMEYWNGAK